MTIVTPMLSHRYVLNISYMTPVENLQSTPTALDTVEPATSQIIQTVASGDLPSFSFNPYSVKYIACLIGAGKNTDTVDQTVYVKMLKNGTSIKTGSAVVTAGYYYTVQACFFDVVVGDTVELRLWASASTVNWDYDAYTVYFSRPIPFKKKRRLHDVTYTLGYAFTLQGGNPLVSADRPVWVHFDTPPDYWRAITRADSPFTYSLQGVGDYGLYLIQVGDRYASNGYYFKTHSLNRPYYERPYAPTKISFRVIEKYLK